MTITILGTGTLGAALAREFTSRDIATRTVSRGEPSGQIPPGVGHTRADATNEAALTAALAGSTVVVHTAQPAYQRWEHEFPALQRSIVNAAAAVGAKLVIADNLYMYGEGDGGVITDGTAERPCSLKGRVRKAMADEALAAHADGRLEVVLTRPSNYVGAGYALTQELLLKPARGAKPMKVLGAIDQPHSFSYVPDVARAMADIALASDAYGRAWVLPSLSPITQRELCDALWSAVGNAGPAKIQALRGLGARAIGLFNAPLRASVEMMYEFEKPFISQATDFEKRFGWSATPAADALRATAAVTVPAN